MDSHHLVDSNLSYSAYPITSSSFPFLHISSFTHDRRNSPNSSPSHFDYETTTTVSGSHSSQDVSTFSTSCGSPAEANSCSLRMSHPLGIVQSTLHLQGAGAWLFHDRYNINLALQQLEVALMAPDDDDIADSYFPPDSPRKAKRRKTMEEPPFEILPSGDLKKLLLACARALEEDDNDCFDGLIASVRSVVSITGEPIQRLGAYLVEGLVARKESSGANIYRALKRKEPESKDLLSYMQILYEICPYLKFGYMAANGAIADACKNEERIHIIDFQIAQGTQWITLLQALAARPGGAPRVRITGLDDPVSMYARGDGLETVGRRLAAVSQKFNIPVEFQGLSVSATDVTKEMLNVRHGEALVVNFPLQLHHTPDESVDVNNPRDGLLRLARSLNPKVITLVEQESNTNTAPFLARFGETLEYYLAMFESIDGTLPKDQKERIGVEQHCLARDIVNVIACEGSDRAERHELFGKWKSRFTMAGFRQYPLSSYVNTVIRSLLRCYSEHYTLVEKEGAMLLGWKDRNLISASAWC